MKAGENELVNVLRRPMRTVHDFRGEFAFMLRRPLRIWLIEFAIFWTMVIFIMSFALLTVKDDDAPWSGRKAETTIAEKRAAIKSR